MQIPKIKLLYYKNILDVCLARFFNDFNDDFIQQDGIYVYANKVSSSKLKSVFTCYVVEELKKHVQPNSVNGADYYFILGACLPKDNILLEVRDGYFPAKLDKLLKSSLSIKYVLKEKDIKLDLVLFNSMFEDIFNGFFKSQSKILKHFGKDYTNLFFLQNSRLDCLTLYKTVKYIYGRSNTANLFEEHFKDTKVVICSINECIDKYVSNKKLVNSLGEFKLIVQEIKQFVDECIVSANGKKQAKNNLGA